MILNEKQILEKIISENGDCGWADENICKVCPMSRLRQRSDGTYLSCSEVIIGSGLSSYTSANAKYKAVAEKLLLDAAVEGILEDLSESE